MQRLPDDLATAIMPVDVVGVSPAEAATAAGQQPKALERHLARARIIARQLVPESAAA